MKLYCLFFRWVRKYGGVLRFYQIFGREAVLIADPEAVRHVLVNNSPNYKRNPVGALREIVPEGLFVVEGEKHRSERKLLNPSLNATAVKGIYHL